MSNKFWVFGAILVMIVAALVANYLHVNKKPIVAVEEEPSFEMSIDVAVSICCIQ